MPNQTILIKPSSGNCNMNCKYCFYYDVMDNREVKSYGFMSLETLENIVKEAFDYADNFIGFAFQGGEPTLSGLSFFESFIEFVNKYKTKNVQVSFSMQTNGLIIDENWAEFFKKNNFLIGLSIDGTKDIHDNNRLDKTGNGTFSRAFKTASLLTKYEVDFNILSVVSKNVAKHPMKIYDFYKKNNFQYIQFIPCLDELGEMNVKNYSLTPKDYGDFLCQLFDLWYKDIIAGKQVSIRMFENIVQMLIGYPPESCDMQGICSVNAVIESDGSVYPCDFYVLDEWNLGNINNCTFEALKTNELGRKFVNDSIEKPNKCQKCEYINICRAGCRRNYINIDGEYQNYFCESYKAFYGYTIKRFRELAFMVSKSLN